MASTSLSSFRHRFLPFFRSSFPLNRFLSLPSSSSSSFSSWLKLSFFSSVTATVFLSHYLFDKESIVHSDSYDSGPRKPSSPPSPSVSPTLPSRSPNWLRSLSSPSSPYQYHNVADYLDFTDHLLYDPLSGKGKIEEVYYFVEKKVVDDESDKNEKGEPKYHYRQGSQLMESIIKEQQKLLQQNNNNNVSSSSSSSSPSPPSPPSSSSASSPSPAYPEICVVFYLGPQLCGHKGIIHGGLTSALIDEVCGAISYISTNYPSFTAQLNVSYKKPLPSHQYILLRGRVKNMERRKVFIEVDVEDGNGDIYAKGSALYIQPQSTMTRGELLAAVH